MVEGKAVGRVHVKNVDAVVGRDVKGAFVCRDGGNGT